MNKTLTTIALLVAVPVLALAQEPVKRTETATVKATIDAIDHQARTVTLKDKDGYYETIYAGPEIKRFDELKVGDKVTFHYTESVILKLRKPDEPAAPSSSGEPVIERGTGPRPSGTVKHQATTTVLVKAIDPAIPAVTIRTEEGRTMSLKLESKALLKGVKAGDRVEITYNEALMISVE